MFPIYWIGTFCAGWSFFWVALTHQDQEPPTAVPTATVTPAPANRRPRRHHDHLAPVVRLDSRRAA